MGRPLSHPGRAAGLSPAIATPLIVSTDLPEPVRVSLVRLGLVNAGEEVTAERLTGGVSSDIWKVSAGDRVFCVKRAMPKLAVKDDWFAPVERNRYERLWYCLLYTSDAADE